MWTSIGLVPVISIGTVWLEFVKSDRSHSLVKLHNVLYILFFKVNLISVFLLQKMEYIGVVIITHCTKCKIGQKLQKINKLAILLFL